MNEYKVIIFEVAIDILKFFHLVPGIFTIFNAFPLRKVMFGFDYRASTMC